MCFLIAPHLPSLPRYDSLDLGPWQLCSTECDDLDADAVERDDLDADAVERDALDEGLRMYPIICIVQHYIINTVRGGGAHCMGIHCRGCTLYGVDNVGGTHCMGTHCRGCTLYGVHIVGGTHCMGTHCRGCTLYGYTL